MDKQGKEKSDLGNDKKSNREKNPVTDVETGDQRQEHKGKDDWKEQKTDHK